MARITRRDLKRNELAETVERTVDYVSHHRKGTFGAVAAAAGVLLLVAGFLLFRGYRERQAGKELSAALEVLEAPLASDPAAAGAPRKYATASDREREATRRLREAAQMGGTVAGRAAQVILAARSENPAEAAESLAKAAREGSAEIAAAAELDAARLLAAQGKTAEAIDRLKRAIESAESAAPKDALIFALAETYERAGSTADARATYQRLIDQYPNSPYRSDARQRISG